MKTSSLSQNILVLCISVAAFLTEPAILQAQEAKFNTLNFTEPLSLSRGKITPRTQDAEYLTHDESCRFAVNQWGWTPESCPSLENIFFHPVPGTDTVIVSTPNTDGYVSFDDWESDSKNAIPEIWKNYVEGAKAQGERLHQNISPIKWLVYPTLVKDMNFLYYAVAVDWNGDVTINAKAIMFDRSGYITFSIVPEDGEINGSALEPLITNVLASYQSKPKTTYAEFRSGDKVAAVGAVGVLATALGVKYGKVATVGLFAIALAFLKKGAAMLVLLPLLLIRRLFRRGKGGDDVG